MKSFEEKKEAFTRLTTGHRLTDVLCAGEELGVFELIAEKPRTAAQAARSLEADRRGIEILLNALVAVDLLAKRKNTFHLTALSKEFLAPDSPNYLGNMVRHVAHLRRNWVQLPDLVKSGKPVARDASSKKAVKKRTRRFIMAMADGSRASARELAATLDLSGVRRALDVGGGPGTFLYEMIRKNSNIRGTVFDVGGTLEITREVRALEGMEEAVDTVEGDFNVDDLGKGYDLALMSSIIHIYSPASNKKLIRKGYRALNPGGRLIVRDFMLNPSKTSPADAALFSVNMLVHTDDGASYSEQEIRSWMKAAGFVKIKRKDLAARSSIMTGVKPAAKKKR